MTKISQLPNCARNILKAYYTFFFVVNLPIPILKLVCASFSSTLKALRTQLGSNDALVQALRELTTIALMTIIRLFLST